MIKFNFLYNLSHSWHIIMYSLFIFLIAFVLFLFEISVSLFFWKSLDSNILIITCVMVLPWIFYQLQMDTQRYHRLFTGSLINRVFRRKQFYFFLEIIESYSLVFGIISVWYFFLFYLLKESIWTNYSILSAIICLIITAASNILRQIFIHS